MISGAEAAQLMLTSFPTQLLIVRVQVYGMAVAVLDEDLKITKLEIFYGEHHGSSASVWSCSA